MKLSWREYLELNDILNDEDFSLLTLLILHPEMRLTEIAKWLYKDVDENDNVIRYSIETIRLKINSLEWKIEKWRGNTGKKFIEFFEEKKIKNRVYKDMIDDMVNRFCQIVLETGKIYDAIYLVLNEYGYPMSWRAFYNSIKRRIGNRFKEELLSMYNTKNIES